MKFILPQTILFLLVVHSVFAQGTLTGIVTDSTNAPLQDVNIYIQAINTGTTSDRLGRFTLRNLQAGSYGVSFSSVGFRSRQQQVSITGETTMLNVTLEPGELILADIVIADLSGAEVNTISQVDIKLRPVNTSQDILRMVPGLFIAQHAGGGKAEQIFLRGFDIDHGTDINLEVDGLPVNMVSHAHGQGYSDLHFMIPEIVGSVDFNKGPYDADKGNFATAGYASFVTKRSLDQNMVKIEGGRFGTLRNVNGIRILDEQKGNWRSHAYLFSEFFRTDGYFERHQHFNRLNMIGKYNAYRGDREALTIGLMTFNSRWDASGQVPVRAIADGTITRFGSIDPTEGGETSRHNVYLRHLKTIDNGGMIENQLYFSRYDFNLVSNFTFFLNDPENGDQITQRESRNIYGYRGNYTLETTLGGMRLRNEVGGGFRYDDVNDINLFRSKSRKQFLGHITRGDIDETNLHFYVNETLSLSPKFTVNAAVRFDHFTFNHIDALTPEYERQSISKGIVSPKLNFTHHVSRNVDLFLKSGLGFHSNDTRVVVAQQGQEILPRAYGVDLGANFKIGDKLMLNTALWMLNLDQEFVYVGDEGIVEPSGKTERKGIDLSIRYQALPWLYIDSDANVTRPKAKGVPEGEDRIPLAPTVTGMGGVTCKMKNGLNASVRYRYLGDRPANESNTVVATGYFLLDAVVKYTRKSYELTFSAENLLNEEWNEAQFDTESRLRNEIEPVSEIHFTPGSPFFFKTGVTLFF